MIQIIEEDFVDWEPLVMRFHAQTELSPAEADRLAQSIASWFDQSAIDDPITWKHAKEWHAEVADGNIVEATCDLMPSQAVPLLAAAVEREFPTICELRLGYQFEGPADPSRIEWFPIESGQVEINGEVRDVAPFTISLYPITVVQFEEFLEATGYRPVPDAKEYDGYLLEYTRGQLGSNPKTPIFSLTHDDACAYCDWSNHRLPSEEELAHFFNTALRMGKHFDWYFFCWSSTPAGIDEFVAVRGAEPQNRKAFHRDECGWPDPACLRVAKAG